MPGLAAALPGLKRPCGPFIYIGPYLAKGRLAAGMQAKTTVVI